MISANPFLTDLYQLTMLQGYMNRGMDQEATFELFLRRLPKNRNFVITAGLAQVVEYLENLRFSDHDLQYLKSTNLFSSLFLSYLESFRFEGGLNAIPEGTPVFANEPLIQITAPLPQAQFIESRLINIVHYQSLIATKAARMRLMHPDSMMIDFGFRRAHGAEAGVMAARAAYLVGFDATATVSAGASFGIPVSGTMAHSFVQAHENESDAFRHFAKTFPQNTILLVDTYDVKAGIQNAIRIADEGYTIKGIRIDSGNLAANASVARKLLNQAGLTDTKIIVSGNLDEFAIERLKKENAPIDGYGIGTRLTTSEDCPNLDLVYKMQELSGKPIKKFSENKNTLPGSKQVYRDFGSDGYMNHDTLDLTKSKNEGAPLLLPALENGKRISALPDLKESRADCQKSLLALPPKLRSLEHTELYEVRIGKELASLDAGMSSQTA